MSNPDIGDITDLENGNDLIIKFTKVPSSGKKFPETKVDVRIKKTPAVDPSNDDLMQKISDQVDIMSLFTEPTYDELKKEFENHINPENDPEPEVEASTGDATDETNSTEPEVPAEPTAEKAPSAVELPSAAKASAVLSPEETKAKFKKMFAEAANLK